MGVATRAVLNCMQKRYYLLAQIFWFKSPSHLLPQNSLSVQLIQPT